MVALEYSVSQDCFHVDDLEYTLQRNIRTSLEQVKNDYRIIALYNTIEEANKASNVFRELIEDKKIELVKEEE